MLNSWIKALLFINALIELILRNAFGLNFKFSESDANDRTQELKPTVDQLQHQKKRTIEISLQGNFH